MTGNDDQQELRRAFLLHQRGSLKEAARLYRRLIARNSDNFQALHFLGLIEANVGNFGEAKRLMARSLSIRPPNIQFVENYATILFQTADFESALDICKAGLKLNSNSVALLYASAISLFKLDRFQEALAQFDKVLLIDAGHVPALNERGSVLAAIKQYEAALASVDKALALNQRYAEAHLNRGNLYSELKRYDDAVAAFDRALALNPELTDARIGRGNVFRLLGRFDESIAAYDAALKLRPDLSGAWLGRGNVYYELKRYDDALPAYDQALKLKPELAEAWLGRGNVFRDLRRRHEAIAAYDNALALKPDLADAWVGRGNVCCDLVRYEDALAAYDKALAIAPDLANAWRARGLALFESNCPTDAIAAFDKALSIEPDFADAISNRIFVLDFVPNAGFEEQQAARNYWWQKVGSVIAERSPTIYRNNCNPERRLKVGYVSADLRAHSAARSFRPMLFNHDKTQFEITCYSASHFEDEVTEDFRQVADRWRSVFQLSDDELFDLIQADQIDILVDLSNHTAGHRLEVFARKPAPVQVTIGGIGTGLRTIDYVFSDPVICPDTVRGLFAEKIFDLPSIMTIEKLPGQMPSPSDPPQLSAGHVTFGVFNRISKISDDAVALWAHILDAVPGSKILMKHFALGQDDTRQRQVERFAAHGIAAERLAFLGSTSREEHLAAFKYVDISLDPFPHNGGISTLESLQLGVPVVALLGNCISSRAAGSILAGLGMGDWVAETSDDYLAIAVKFASMPDHLKALRNKIPAKILNSALGDAAIYTKSIENGYRTMWRNYCRLGEERGVAYGA
jgi:predicted O-linked N-acetylglucosamine transferase (SPINDLY family)